MIENILKKQFPSIYRPDIDGLRAIAVISVVIFHAFPRILPGGFIGVDIFFVISGYLISNILLNNLTLSQFSLAQFYGRRVLRIFPALIVVLIFCLALGWFLLLSDEYQQLGKQTVSGVVFLSNFSLWQEAGYFDGTSERKLLLHLWSLAIEEQFYLFWPICLWCAWKINKFLLVLVLVTIVSFAANVLTISSDVSGTFYLPQYRIWELAIGGLLAYLRIGPSKKIVANSLSVTGVALLVCGFFFIGRNSLFPGWWSLLPTLGTVLLITSGNASWFNRNVLSNKVMVLIGLISYPLYLWHWPLLTFTRIYWGHPDISKLIIASIISIPLAYLTFRFIETPIRNCKFQFNTKVITFVAISTLVGMAGLAIYLSNGVPERNLANKYNRIESDLKWNYWDDKSCIKSYNISPCQITSNKPIKILIFGDSHANHLFPGIAQNVKNYSVMNIGSCAPLKDILIFVSKNQEHHSGRSEACINSNFSLLETTSSIETVIVSMFPQPLIDGRLRNQKDYEYWGKITLKSNVQNESHLPQSELVKNGLIRTLQKISALHKKIIFVRDTPHIPEDFRDYCLKRSDSGAKSEQCTIPRELYETQRIKETDIVNTILSELPNVYIFDPINLFCDESVCFLVKDGRSLYRDHHHLSEYGSNIIGQAIESKYFKN
jgi:peptidoglycan/LPS O-acetylase OafA/YrhL